MSFFNRSLPFLTSSALLFLGGCSSSTEEKWLIAADDITGTLTISAQKIAGNLKEDNEDVLSFSLDFSKEDAATLYWKLDGRESSFTGKRESTAAFDLGLTRVALGGKWSGTGRFDGAKENESSQVTVELSERSVTLKSSGYDTLALNAAPSSSAASASSFGAFKGDWPVTIDEDNAQVSIESNRIVVSFNGTEHLRLSWNDSDGKLTGHLAQEQVDFVATKQ